MATQYTITGVIEGSDGSKSEFLMIAGLGGGAWSQWGDANKEQLSDRVEYLDAMSTGLADNSNYYRQEDSEEDEPEDEPEEADDDGYGVDGGVDVLGQTITNMLLAPRKQEAGE